MRVLGSWIALVHLLGSALIVGGCGGGGGGAPTPSVITFHYGSISASVDPDDFRRSIGTATLQPDGRFVAEIETNIQGGAPQASTSTGVLTLAQGGRAALHVDGALVLDGYHSDNGAVVILASNGRIGATPALVVLTRDDRDIPLSDVEGLFLVNGVENRSTEGEFSGFVHAYSVGPSPGDIRVPAYRNTNSQVTGSLAVPLRVLGVDVVGGRVRMQLPFSTRSVHGSLSADREFLWASGTALSEDPISAWTGAYTMIRTSTTTSDQTFAGRYGYVMLRRFPLPAFQAWRGVLQADGAGSATILESVINTEGAAATLIDTVPVTSAVNARGEFTCQVGGSNILQGAISTSGRYATLGGSLTNGLSPQCWIMVRLPPE